MLEIGSVLAGKYKILNVIGKGGMSIVYLAMNERVNKQWAVKEIIKKDEEDFVLELQEIEMMKKLKHPHLPSIVDVIEQNDSLLIVMDYIEGQSLEAVLEEQGIQSKEIVLSWGKQLCAVLEYLHSQNPPIIYRDMKPGNVMQKPDGTLVLIDFGAAREYKPQNRKDTILLGTRGYAAPEQYCENGQTDERSDIYCLGVMLFQFLTGELPQNALAFSEWGDFDGLEVVLSKCMQFRKEERYQSAEELSFALEHYWEYDKEYRKQQRKKKIIFFIILFGDLLFVFLTGMFHWMEKNTREHNYETYLIKAKSAPNVTEALENYRNAIGLNPEEEKGYMELLEDCFLNDDYLSVQESEQLRLILNDYGNGKETNFQAFERNQKGYERFAYEAGVVYFYKFEEKSNKKNAKAYFEIASNGVHLQEHQKERAKRLYLISEYYYKIGLVDCAGDDWISYGDYWKDLTALAEGNLVEVDNERTALVVYEELVAQMFTKTTEFRDAGISKQEMSQQLENIKLHLKSDFSGEEKDRKQLLLHIAETEKMVESVFSETRKRE